MKNNIIDAAMVVIIILGVFALGVNFGVYVEISENKRTVDLKAPKIQEQIEYATTLFRAKKSLQECVKTEDKAIVVLGKANKAIDQCLSMLDECRNPAPVFYDHMLPGDPHFSPANDSRKAVELNSGTTNYGEVTISAQPLNCAIDMKGNSLCQ